MKSKITYQLIVCMLCTVVPITVSCTAKKQNIQLLSPQEEKKESQKLDTPLLEYDTEGFIDNNTFRVIVIAPNNQYYNEEFLIQKGRERAFVSLKNYVLSLNKQFNYKVQNYLTTTINSYGTLTKRDAACSNRCCYYYDIKKEGLKAEIDSIGR